jgi:thiol-disulfide isomerase/thioredoxin
MSGTGEQDRAHDPELMPGGDDPIDARPPDETSAEPAAREFTLGLPAIALGVVAVLVVVMGFLIGRQTLGRDQVAQAPGDVAQGASTGESRVKVIEMGDITGGSVTIGGSGEVAVTPTLAIDNSQPAAPEGEVIILPRKDHPLLGKSAPDFTMKRHDTGEEISLAGLKGRPVLVNFWATWCPPCRLEMPWFQNVYTTHADKNLVVLAIDAGEKVPPDMVPEAVSRYADTVGLTFPILLGENTYEVQRTWSVFGLPATFLIAADGTVVDFLGGAFPNQATLEARLAPILK